MGTMLKKKYLIPFALSTSVGILAAVVILMVIDASLLKIPQVENRVKPKTEAATPSPASPAVAPDYKAITERNLFRAKLEVEIPKPKSEKEIEEELLTGIIKTMTLKGIMTGNQKKDDYAVIDRGGQKGVWIYELGEIVEKGLALKEIRKDAVVLQKGDFGALLRLFAVNAERITVADAPSLPPKTVPVPKKPVAQKAGGAEIRREGKTVIISRKLADKIKNDNGTIMSTVAVRVATDASGRPEGYRVVAIDKESVVGKMGLKAEDLLQSVNGHSLKSAQDLKKLYEDLRNATRFELKVLRKGKPETILYEIR